MDRAPKSLPGTASQLIAMAAVLVGSAERVRQQMQASAEEFHLYQIGRREPDSIQFGRLVDLIVREQNERLMTNRAAVARVRARLKLGRQR